ncbi:MAG: hypothetical protein U0R76_17310 [Candidatus Nanopelagicales bacterium]
MLTRARQAVDALDPDRVVLLGFSAGVVPAQIIAATDPRAVRCVALSSVLSVRALELDEGWPADVPLQFHTMDADPWRRGRPGRSDPGRASATRCRSSPTPAPATCSPTRRCRPSTTPAAELLWSRVEEFLRAIDEG